jgi:AAHS family 4-hydroxybenzoate transporter-like MFS transporter
MAEVVQVSRLLDQRGLSSFHYNLIFWSVLLSLIDGYDIAAIAFAAPHLVREWQLKPGALGPVFSASLIGILVGSAFFGWVGDRYGRKTALIASNLVFGVFTLAAAWSTNLDQMFWLRLLAGLGIGGVIPNVVALNTESAPRRLRATLGLIGVGFVPLGGAIPGFVAATLVPAHGWQILFMIGGIVPIAFAIIGMFTLPESIKFMALHENQRAKMEKTVRAIDPTYVLPANAKFVIEDEQQQFKGFNPAHLFKQGLWLITPLMWLLFALNLMGYFFLLSWTPTLMAVLKLPPATGALAGAMIQVGGTVGSLALARWFERYRFFAIAIVFLVAVPIVALIGYAGLTSTTALLVTTFLAGFCVLGIQTGINVTGALVYPTSLRANGSGWQLGIGRIGSIIGPLVGALFVGLPVEKLYMWSALPFLAGAIVCFAIWKLNEERLRAYPELQAAQAPAR